LELITGAFFFVIRSCEHIYTPNKPRMKILNMSNFTFFQKKKSSNLELVDYSNRYASLI
jgi:hypothetical protein